MSPGMRRGSNTAPSPVTGIADDGDSGGDDNSLAPSDTFTRLSAGPSLVLEAFSLPQSTSPTPVLLLPAPLTDSDAGQHHRPSRSR